MNAELEYRSANLGDCDEILRLRNQKDSLKFQLFAEPIAPDTHKSWFSDRLVRLPREPFLVFLSDNTIIGYCRADRKDNSTYKVSISLDPLHQGHGIGTAMLNIMVREASLVGVTLVAYVHKENVASGRIFKKCGFQIDHTITDKCFDTYKRNLINNPGN